MTNSASGKMKGIAVRPKTFRNRMQTIAIRNVSAQPGGSSEGRSDWNPTASAGGFLIAGRIRGLAAVLAVLLLIGAACCGPALASETALSAVRFGLHREFTRLVFDAEGSQPSQIDESHMGETRVLFDQLNTKIRVKRYRSVSSLVLKVRIESVGNQSIAVISHRVRGVRVEHMILEADPPKEGAYRLVLDFYHGREESTSRDKAEKGALEGSNSPEIKKQGAGTTARNDAPKVDTAPTTEASIGPSEHSTGPSGQSSVAGKAMQTPQVALSSAQTALAPTIRENGDAPSEGVAKASARQEEKAPDAIPKTIAGVTEKTLEQDPSQVVTEEMPSQSAATVQATALSHTESPVAANPANTGSQSEASLGGVQLVAAGSGPKVDHESQGRALYRDADEYYFKHQHELRDQGNYVLSRYKAAMAAAPDDPEKPVALYRSGEAALAMGGMIMAEGFFRRLIAEYPEHPLVGPAWLQIGKSKYQLEQYAEAIDAFQSAMQGSLDRSQHLEANYLYGACLTLVGDQKQAITALNKCLTEDPKYYLKEPDILLRLGESYFVGKDYENSLKYLFWYLNLGIPAPEQQNLVFARLAECLQQEGDLRLANRLYSYIQSYLPDSDGAIIARIREAEQLEKKGDRGLQSALDIYKSLAHRNLSDSMNQLVTFRLGYTYWQSGDPEKALSIVEQFLEENVGSHTLDEFYPLKLDLVKSLIRKSYTAGNYLAVAALDEKDNDLLRMETDLQVDPMIAKSYEQLKLYPRAVTLYQRLVLDDSTHKDRWLLQAAKCSLEMKKLDDAAKFCELIRDPSMLEESTGIMARIYFARQQYPKAATQFAGYFKTQKDLTKVDWKLLADYISCLMALGRNKEALVYLQKASEHPAESEGHHHLELCLLLGKCYEELSQPKDALPFYEEALQLMQDPDRKDYMIYKVAKLYKSIGNIDEAKNLFTQLLGSRQSLWQTVAKEELNDISIAQTAL